MPINGLTINQEKKIRLDRLIGGTTRVTATDPYHLLALAISKYRRIQQAKLKVTTEQRYEVIREIDFWLDKLGIK